MNSPVRSNRNLLDIPYIRGLLIFGLFIVPLFLVLWGYWFTHTTAVLLMVSSIWILLLVMIGVPIYFRRKITHVASPIEKLVPVGMLRDIVHFLFDTLLGKLTLSILSGLLTWVFISTFQTNVNGVWFYTAPQVYLFPGNPKYSASVQYESEVLFFHIPKTFVVQVRNTDTLSWMSQPMSGTFLYPAKIRWSAKSDVWLSDTKEGRFVYYFTDGEWKGIRQDSLSRDVCMQDRATLKSFLNPYDAPDSYIYCPLESNHQWWRNLL